MRYEVTPNMRSGWDKRIGYLFDYSHGYITDREEEFLSYVSQARVKNVDLSERQSLMLDKLYRKVERKVG